MSSTKLGLFNGTITIPQIVAAVLGGVIFKLFGGMHQLNMIVFAGVLLIIGGVCVFTIRETYAEKHNVEVDPLEEENEPF